MATNTTTPTTPTATAPPTGCDPADPLAFDLQDIGSWTESDWANGSPFYSYWHPENSDLLDALVLELDDEPCTSTPDECFDLDTPPNYFQYASGELASNTAVTSGWLEADLTAGVGDGIVTGLFFYQDGAVGGDPHDEIDIEILGKDPSCVQFTYFVQATDGVECAVELGYDASVEEHNYAISWTASALEFYVDDVLRHQVTAAETALPTLPSKVYANLWPADPSSAEAAWAGTYTGTETSATFNTLCYSPTHVGGGRRSSRRIASVAAWSPPGTPSSPAADRPAHVGRAHAPRIDIRNHRGPMSVVFLHVLGSGCASEPVHDLVHDSAPEAVPARTAPVIESVALTLLTACEPDGSPCMQQFQVWPVTATDADCDLWPIGLRAWAQAGETLPDTSAEPQMERLIDHWGFDEEPGSAICVASVSDAWRGDDDPADVEPGTVYTVAIVVVDAAGLESEPAYGTVSAPAD